MGLTAKDVIEQTGIPRATVYRRLKNETPEEIIASVRPGTVVVTPVETDESADADQSAIEWANSILWAAKHASEPRMSRAKAGSQVKYAMWQFARDNAKELVISLVPKALGILDKNKKPTEEAEMEQAEKASIAELQELLAGAIKEAGLAA